MLGITHRICVALTIVVLFCSTYNCLQINLEESVSLKLENVDVYPADSDVTDSTKIEETYTEIAPEVTDIIVGEKESYDEQVSEVLKRKVINALKSERKVRQARSNHGYESLYPQVPSGPLYNQYQPSAPQWNSNTYNYSQTGFPSQQGYKPNQGSFNPSQQPYNTNQRPYNPNQGTYNPGQVPYNPGPGTFNSSHLPYNPNQGSYNPSSGSYSPGQGQYNQTNRPYNSNTGSNYPSNVPYNPNQGQYNYSNTRPYNPSAGLTPYGSYSTTSRTYYPVNNQSLYYNRNTSVPPYSNKPQNSAVNFITTPRPYNSGYNNSYTGQQHYNNNYPTNPNNGSQRPPYNNNYNPSQNPPYPYSNVPSTNPSSQYPQNSNPYGYNTNSYPQNPTQNFNPRNSTYPQHHYK